MRGLEDREAEDERVKLIRDEKAFLAIRLLKFRFYGFGVFCKNFSTLSKKRDPKGN